MRVITKYSATDISTANGAAAMNHSSQVMVLQNAFSMKPIATMFCAAAVLMPTFQMLAVCIVVIISMPAKAPVLSTPKAAMMPSVIGTRQATRAVVEGTISAITNPTRMAPIDDVSGFGAGPRQDGQRDALVEARCRHRGRQKKRRRDQHQRGIGKAAERESQRRAGAHQHLGIGDARRQPEQECHQRGDHDRRYRVVDGFRHPDDDGEAKNSEHAMGRDRQVRRRRQ